MSHEKDDHDAAPVPSTPHQQQPHAGSALKQLNLTGVLRHFPGGSGGVGGIRLVDHVLLVIADGKGEMTPVMLPVAGIDALIEQLRELETNPAMDAIATAAKCLTAEAQR